MADATYCPKVYRKLGGDEMVIASGGAITVEAGGIAPVCAITAYTTSGSIPVAGISSIAGGAARAYKLPAPGDTYKGYRKTVYCLSSSGNVTLTCTAGTFMAADKHVITFGSAADGVTIDLLGTSTANWSIVGYSTAWTTTVKCT